MLFYTFCSFSESTLDTESVSSDEGVDPALSVDTTLDPAPDPASDLDPSLLNSAYTYDDVGSIDDLSTLTPKSLLHKAAKAANLRVIMHALALGANANEGCEDNEGKTPLIRAVESVS